MLIIMLFVAVAVYIGLYLAWDFFSGHLNTPTAWLDSLNRMMLRPESEIFFTLRGLILVIALYVIGDFLMTTGKRVLKRKEPPEEMKLKTNALPADKVKR